MADADGATPIAEIRRLEKAIEQGADLAVGSRALRDRSVARQMRAHRQLVGTVFNLIVRALGVWHVTDTQCGFKLLRGEVAAELFPEVRTDGFGFDVELLLLAQRRGYRIVEVPINWVDQPGSRVSVIKEGPRMLAQVLAARLRLGFGRGSRRAP
jgi:dolichyl-phosphate beta-glucosyltransferase